MCFRFIIFYKLGCGRYDAIYYGETCRHFKVGTDEDSSISLLRNRRRKSKKTNSC